MNGTLASRVNVYTRIITLTPTGEPISQTIAKLKDSFLTYPEIDVVYDKLVGMHQYYIHALS